MPAFGDDLSVAAIASDLGGALAGHSPVSAVARRLLVRFTSGEVPLGARLPPERQLALALGVGRSAVREALAALEVLGVVEVRPGSGTYLRSSVSELLPETLSWGLMLGRPRAEELLELRQLLEAQAASLAARRSTEEQLHRLDECLVRMAASAEQLAEFVAADLAFHQVVGEASGNLVLAELLVNLRSLLRVWTERALTDPAEARLALAQHHAVARALERGDPAGASEAMADHMASAGRRLSALLPPSEATGQPVDQRRSRP